MKFKSKPDASGLAAVRLNTDATYLEPLGRAGWWAIKSPTLTVAQLMSVLGSDSAVAKVEPDYAGGNLAVSEPAARPMMMSGGPDDPLYPQQWAYSNTGQCYGANNCGTPGDDINAEPAWALATNGGSKSVVLVIYGTGIDFNNPDLAANVWTAPHPYTITEGGNVYNCPTGAHGFDAYDYQSGCTGQVYDNDTVTPGHGTIVAGVADAVSNNQIGLAGTADNVTILPITICSDEDCDSMTAITGIDASLQIAQQFGLYLVAGNMSHGNLGGSAMEDEMRLASNQTGIIFVASTGDQGGGVEDPASFYLPDEIAVSGSNVRNQVACWPSGTCSSTGGDVAAPGDDIWTTRRGDTVGDNPILVGGTSVSAPFVAGTLGLLASLCPLPPSSLIETVENTATQVPALGSIATDGRLLNMGAAISSCAGPGHAPSTATLKITLYQNTSNPDTGSISVTVAGRTASYNYDTSQDTAETVAQELSFQIDSKYVQATWTGEGNITITTLADGPYTDYPLQVGVSNDCVPADECGRAPSIIIESVFSGGY